MNPERPFWRDLAVIATFLVGLALCPPVQAQDRGIPAPSLEDVAYGPHERNKLDLWQAESEKPTPLLIFIHGGGFVNGDKGQVRKRPVVRQCLDAGVSFASINYRFREHAAIQDILRDAARAVQYIRSRAGEWNIDPDRIASFGSSAGAGTSLWLAFHDDLADPASDDPVLRQSSRLTAAGSLDGQVSYDLRDWEKYVGASPYERSVADRLAFYRFDSQAQADSPAGDKVMRDCSMIELISAGDPPVVCACRSLNTDPADRSHYVHHPKHALAIAERCKEQGVECVLLLADGDHPVEPDRQQRAAVAFLLEKLTDDAQAGR